MEQKVARWAHNPKVDGSSPSTATNSNNKSKLNIILIYFFLSLIHSFILNNLYDDTRSKNTSLS